MPEHVGIVFSVDIPLSMNVTDVPNVTDGINGTNGTMAQEPTRFIFVLFVIVVPILFGIITLLGTIGNCLVIYVIISRKRMRTTTNILLLNLAIADLSFVLICVPFTAYVFATMHLTHISRWPFGDVMCRLMHYLLNVTAYVTVYTLVLISVIRYLTILYTTQTTRLRTKRNVVFMSLGVWFTMMLVNVPIILSYKVDIVDGKPDCDMTDFNQGKAIYGSFFTFAYVIPLVIIVVLSVSILNHINKQRPTLMDKKKRKSNDKKRQATRLIILVVVIFGICWLPIHIHLLCAYFATLPESEAYLVIGLFWNILAYFNSCINPIIYNFASKEFRDSFREVVCCTRMLNDRRQSAAGTRYTNIAACTLTVPNGEQHQTTVKTSTAGKESSSDV